MKILLGVTGSIAAYKACDIVSGLKAHGHEVRVIMTESAKQFITEMSLASISGNVVTTTMWNELNGKIDHIDLAKWADAFVIAPATANIIAKIANGICDDVLSTIACVIEGKSIPKFIAPAMNTSMWESPRTQMNVTALTKREINPFSQYIVIPPDSGLLACGDTGEGKLAKPRKIVEIIQLNLAKRG
jgi:phosphopantothenoylcysteine synthetase/decarboxylase